jgi:nucleotide-binding universal stress UspA family protein
MPYRPSVLCPIDFSEPSRASLAYAAAIANHFGATLTIVTVDDPLLAEAAKHSQYLQTPAEATEHELRRFCAEVLPASSTEARKTDFRVVVGKPAQEILRVAKDVGAELIVMGSHGRSGAKKLFFGSTTERVLRETTVPVLVTPDDRPRAVSIAEMTRHIRHVLAPVDLTSASPTQVVVAADLAAALSVPLIVAHVLEPIFIPMSVRAAMPDSSGERRADAEGRLAELIESSAKGATTEPVILTGDPSEEIVKLAEVRNAGLIVMGLHSSGMLGPRMGSVTYRVLCLAQALVLALPPAAAASGARRQDSASLLAL